MRKLKFFVLFGMILSLGIASNVVNVSAFITTSSRTATADTYSDFHPDHKTETPYLSDVLKAGTDDGTPGCRYYRSYLYFDLTNIPSNIIKAEITLEVKFVTTYAFLNVNVVEGDWDESTFSGDDCSDEFTADIDGDRITTVNFTSTGTWNILVTDYIEGRSNLSINLESFDNSTLNQLRFIEIYSSNQILTTKKHLRPKITWTYENNEIDPTIYAIIAGCVVLGVLGFAGAGFYIYKKKGSPPLRSTTEETPFTTRRAKKSDKICWYCDNAIPKNFNVCPNCGAALE